MTVLEHAAATISLDVGCSDDCDMFSRPLLAQLALGGRYRECSVLPLPATLADWSAEHRTARKRAGRCARRGYRFGPVERHRHLDDIHAINTSLAVRQGRRMSDSYLRRPHFAPHSYPCARHGVHQYGVYHQDGRLVAYLWLYRAGDLALVSSILGHGDYLPDEIMYLLAAGTIDAELRVGPGFLVYNRHDSGTDGLRFYKERLGMCETEVTWAP